MVISISYCRPIIDIFGIKTSNSIACTYDEIENMVGKNRNFSILTTPSGVELHLIEERSCFDNKCNLTLEDVYMYYCNEIEGSKHDCAQ